MVVGDAFKGVFGIGPGMQFAFAIVDIAGLQNFLHFAFVDMATSHAAAGMFGINEMRSMTIELCIAIIPGFEPPGERQESDHQKEPEDSILFHYPAIYSRKLNCRPERQDDGGLRTATIPSIYPGIH